MDKGRSVGEGMMPVFDRRMLYDIIYALAAKDGRESALFGTCAPVAKEAFCRSLVGDTFPELWFELPLAGDPWFDLHSLVSHADIAGTNVRYAGHEGRYDDALTWFASCEEGVRQLAMSYDVSSGDIDCPAVQLLVDRRGSDVVGGFLGAVGRPEALDAWRTFCRNMPDSWYACYTGVFPGRVQRAFAPFLRMECIVNAAMRHEYVRNGPALAGHLRDVGGFWANDTLVVQCQQLVTSPFPFEFQFDVQEDGSAGPTLGASVRFHTADWMDAGARGSMAQLMDRVSSWGLADDRWRLLADMVYAKRVTLDDKAVSLYCYPAFLKLRWRDGAPLDAKAYLIAGVDPVRRAKA